MHVCSALLLLTDLAEECKKYFLKRETDTIKRSEENYFRSCIISLFRSPIYEELNVLEPKTPLQIVIKEDKEERKESEDLVLQSMNKDYAAFYGNPHLSCHLLQEEP